MNVTHCHVRVTIEQVKRCLGRSIITIDKRSAVYLLWHTHTHTRTSAHTAPVHAQFIYTYSCAHTHTHLHSTFIQLKSISAPKLPSEISLVGLHACVPVWASLRYVHVCVHTVFPYVRVTVHACVWGCAVVPLSSLPSSIPTCPRIDHSIDERWGISGCREPRGSVETFTETTQWAQLKFS